MLENDHKIKYYRNLWWLSLSVLVIILDRVTKLWALHHLPFEQPVYVLSFFNLTLAYNTGAAFNLFSHFQGGQRWLLGLFCVLISVAIIVWLVRLSPKRKLTGFALALILGGGLANLWDRITLGYVIDFIQWHVQQWSWPIFNIGDTAISIGAVLLIIELLWFSERKKNS